MPDHSHTGKPDADLFAPGVMPSKSGGLILVSPAGNQVRIPDSEVETTIERMQTVRRLQLRADCSDIAGVESGPDLGLKVAD